MNEQLSTEKAKVYVHVSEQGNRIVACYLRQRAAESECHEKVCILESGTRVTLNLWGNLTGEDLVELIRSSSLKGLLLLFFVDNGDGILTERSVVAHTEEGSASALAFEREQVEGVFVITHPVSRVRGDELSPSVPFELRKAIPDPTSLPHNPRKIVPTRAHRADDRRRVH